MQERASEWWMVELFLKGCLEKAAQKAADAATAAGAAGRQWGRDMDAASFWAFGF